MNKKGNRKILYSIVYSALSILSFWSWPFWVEVGGKVSAISDFNWFMFQTFNWSNAVFDISYFGPLMLSAVFLLLATYFGVMGVKQNSNNEKTGMLWIIVASIAFLSILLFIIGLIFIGQTYEIL